MDTRAPRRLVTPCVPIFIIYEKKKLKSVESALDNCSLARICQAKTMGSVLWPDVLSDDRAEVWKCLSMFWEDADEGIYLLIAQSTYMLTELPPLSIVIRYASLTFMVIRLSNVCVLGREEDIASLSSIN